MERIFINETWEELSKDGQVVLLDFITDIGSQTRHVIKPLICLAEEY